MELVRRVGAAALILAAVIVWFLMAPEDPLPDNSIERRVDDVMATDELNSATSDNVYQQQVTNGWVARDLLEIVARTQAEPVEPATEERVPAEIALAVVGVALLLLTGSAGSRRVTAAGPDGPHAATGEPSGVWPPPPSAEVAST